MKKIRIEDLLEREPIQIENQQLIQDVKGKRILVTGAAGSIGSELVRLLKTRARHPHPLRLSRNPFT